MQFKISEAGVKFGTSGVRGLVTDLTDRVCYGFAKAFWQACGEGEVVVVGHDLRPSSPEITQAVIAALSAEGLRVVYVGALATPAIAYYAATFNAPAVVVTGSHIPFDRNGIKFYNAKGEIGKREEQAIATATVDVPEAISLKALPAIDAGAEQAYLARYLDFFGSDLCDGLRVAIYQHSSVARDLIAKLFEQMGAEVIALGRTEQFVPIDTEAVRAEDRKQAKVWAKEGDFDLLVSTDGDADRPLIGDVRGDFLRGDIVGVLTAYFLGADTVVTPVSSNTALEKSNWFKETLRTQIGSPYVIAGMEQAEGVVAGFEANGGFLLGSDLSINGKLLSALPTRDAILPMLAIIALAIQHETPVSRLTKLLPARFTASDRIPEIPTAWSQELLAKLNAGDVHFSSLVEGEQSGIQTVDQTDGYRVTFTSGNVVHLRPSGNAPELRCYAESDNESTAEALCAGTLNCVAELYKSSI